MKPSVTLFLKEADTLCYTAYPSPFFDESKKRVSKGGVRTEKIAKLPGTWDDSVMRDDAPCYMMRCGAKPEGSGFLVLDVDVHGSEKAEVEFMKLHNFLVNTTGCVVRTPSGGLHYYYKIPEGMNWGVERKCESIMCRGTEYDTTRLGEGRLDILATGIGVLLPGSTYRYNNRDYVYEYFKGQSLADAWPVPECLIKTFNEREKMKTKSFRLKAKVTTPSPPTPPVGLGAVVEVIPAPGRSHTPLRTAAEDLTLIASLMDCLTGEWVSNYENWRDLGFCIKTITAGRGEDMYVRIAKRSPRHNTSEHEAASRKLFAAAAANGSFGFASLNWWARKCSPDKHHECFKKNYMMLLNEGAVGHASIFATELAGSCVYDAANKRFWLWVEHKLLWVEVNEDNITSQFLTLMPLVVKRLLASLPPEPEAEEGAKDTPRKKLVGRLCEFQNTMKESVMKCVRDCLNPKVSYRNIDGFELDCNPNYLPLGNGVWNFKEHRLEPYTRQHYLSKRAGVGINQSPLEWDGEASQEDIKEAMRVWFKGCQPVIDFIQYWLGYVITGYTDRQEFMIVFGQTAGNGKSTLISSILQKDILGREYATTMGEDALTKVGGNNDDIYYGMDSRLAVVTEAGGDGKNAQEINTECLKRITGEDVISAQAKFKGKKEGVFNGKTVFVCNSMPKMPQDKGQRRRTIVAEMNVKMLSPEEWAEKSDEEKASGDYGVKNPGFIAKLRANRAGTLNWLLDGAKRYLANRTLAPPVEVMRYTEEALAASDVERVWFRDGWRFDKGSKVEPTSFKDIAAEYCEHFGVKPTNGVAKGRLLKKIKDIVGEAYVIGDSNHGFFIRCLTRIEAVSHT